MITSLLGSVDWLMVLFAAIGAFMVGFFWYSPMLFGKQWMELTGIPMDGNENVGPSMAQGLLWTFIRTVVLALCLMAFQVTSFMEAIPVVVVLWLGFDWSTGMSGVIWENYKLKLHTLHSVGCLVSLLVSALILTFA